jgi:hypothetical protein
MFKKSHIFKVKSGLEVVLKHPIAQIGEVSMYVLHMQHLNSYLFTIPFHKWSYLKPESEDINVEGPSSFKNPQFKGYLKTEMLQAMQKLSGK